MIAVDEDSLICDLAETYNIYNYRSFSPFEIATFSVGLRDNSRVKMKLNGLDYPFETILLANAVDQLTILAWMKTKDGANGRNKPEAITAKLLNSKKEESNYESFDSSEAYEARIKELKRKVGKNGN